MAKTLINKHIDDSSSIRRGLFTADLSKAKGEIIINNDPNNPSIYIVNNNDEVVKISGDNNTGGIEYDDTRIWSQVNDNTNAITYLRNNMYDDTEVRNIISDNTESIEELKESVQENIYDDTEVRKMISDNTESIEEIKERAYDDTELRQIVSANTEAIEELKESSSESVLSETITVAGLSDIFGAGNYSNNDVIPAGTSFTEIFLNILCKEMFPNNVKTRSASATVFLSDLTLALSHNYIAEVGSLVSLVSGRTNGVYFDTIDSEIYNMDYGYSLKNDNIKISSDTFIKEPCKISIENPYFTISSEIVSGFNADNLIYITTTPTTKASADDAILDRTTLGCLSEGENTIKIKGLGPYYKYSANKLQGVYYCSNLGKTNENERSDSVDEVSGLITPVEKTKSETIIGAYKYFLGYSEYQSVDDFKSNPNEIRTLRVKSDFIEIDGTTIVTESKLTSNGSSIVIACPKKYKLATIEDNTGANLLGSFTSRGEVDITVGGTITATYNVYLLPIANGTKLEFKNVTLTLNNK